LGTKAFEVHLKNPSITAW